MMAGLIRLPMLTAQRGGELHGARWEEFDLVGGWWTIPASRSKNKLFASCSVVGVRRRRGFRGDRHGGFGPPAIGELPEHSEAVKFAHEAIDSTCLGHCGPSTVQGGSWS